MTDRLTTKQEAVLNCLMANQGWVGLSSVAAAMGTHPNGVSRTLGSLINRGLVEKRTATGGVSRMGHVSRATYYRAKGGEE